MANEDGIRSNNEDSKSTWQVKRKLVPAETEEQKFDPVKNSSKRRKTEKSTSAKVKAHNQKKSGRKNPYINHGNAVDEQQKSCHQCHRNDKDRVVECKKCQSKKFCVPCLTKWYPDTSVKEFVEACPFCRKICNCKACLRRFSPQATQGYSCSKPDKIRFSKYILQKAFPLVRLLNEEQLKEKEFEAKVKGLSLSELQLQDAECDVDDELYCDNCGAYLFDLYRSCACGFDICLACCHDLRDGNSQIGYGMKYGWKSCLDGSIPCPPKDIGGCNCGRLELKRILPIDWVVNMLEKAQEIYKINTLNDYENDIPGKSTKCSMCNDSTQEKSNASCLYSSSAKDIHPQSIQHFQLHWSKGEPIIVNDVLSTSLGLSWEPMVLWRAFRDTTKSSKNSKVYEVDAIDCFDWNHVTIDLYKFFRGYSEGGFEIKGLPMILKLEDWQPKCVFEGEWPRHFVEFVGCLPFKDYTHPHDGYMNIAVKLPDLSTKPDVGPRMDIAYGVEEELEYGNSVTKLHYDGSDTVNILAHTQKHGDTMKEGALWDIFRREDIFKLEKYLRNHSEDFIDADFLSEQMVHPIHDRIFYLTMEHKRKLKEEFGIEPWTFKQKLGDAVFIPAGCPYQVRNLKSSTKVELNFISPESLGECIRLQHELRMLPNNHIAKKNRLNIAKMMLYALDHAAMELTEVRDSNEPIDDLQFVKPPATLNGYDANNFDHTNGWVDDTESDDNSPESKSRSDLSATSIPQETEGLWRENDVGPEAKKLLETVERQYPDTFQAVQISGKAMWISILKEFHVIVKGFLETSMDAVAEDRIISLGEDLKEFERFGFDLSWAHKRLDMVKRLKFGNEPLQQELMALEESLGPLREKLGERWKQYVEAHEMLKAAQLEYDNATDARNKKAREVARQFGDEYDQVLKGHLGFGMLPGY